MMTIKRKAAAGALSALLLVAAPAASAQQQTPQQVAEQFGGIYDGPQAGYVRQIGERMAEAQGMRGRCTFTLINSDVVNAFAEPNCNIYVTRGLLAAANSEAELAYVLGHEVGHVTARHSQGRQRTSILTQLGALIVGGVTGSSQLAQLLAQGAQLYTLNYSREQEYQSDDLGIRAMTQTGYDPYAAADMLNQLTASDRLEATVRERTARSTPEWARTHPLTENRVRRAFDRARATGLQDNQRPENEAAYLAAVDGMLVGDDPEQGFIEGRSFLHPVLRVAFEAPQGFSLTNSPQAVGVEGPNGVRAQFAGGRFSGSLENRAVEVLRGVVGQSQVQLGQAQRTTVNGLETVILPARAQSQSGVIDLTVAVYRFGPDTAYHFVTLAQAGRGPVFTPLIRSVRRLSDQEAAQLRPRVIDVVTVGRNDTVQSLAGRMAYRDFQLERFRTLNGLSPNQSVTPGQRVKIVVYGQAR